ncbi:hypothetical protein Q0F98_12890 [Paenibacillus amylolyticus]|nr:hypothetical protein Q0F98_12890 [Paenibacillus amylolyticus]
MKDIVKTGNTVTFTVYASEALKQDTNYGPAYIQGLFSVDAGSGVTATVSSVTINTTDKRTITVTANVVGNTDGKVATVKFDGEKNKAAKAINDENGNALGEFSFGKEL